MKNKFRVGDAVTYTHDVFGSRRGRVVNVVNVKVAGCPGEDMVEVHGGGFGAWVEPQYVRLDLIATLAQIE